jgi:hypothetical protein
MRRKAYFAVAIAMIIPLGVGGIAETVGATPDESQRLRGLGGRTFEVEVTNLTTGDVFANCYTFNEDGTWIDPLFPAPGVWSQNSNGASTSYSGEASFFIPGVISASLVQEGTVTPAGGRGILQLEAHSTAVIEEEGAEPFTLEFLSVGFQNNECTLP